MILEQVLVFWVGKRRFKCWNKAVLTNIHGSCNLNLDLKHKAYFRYRAWSLLLKMLCKLCPTSNLLERCDCWWIIHHDSYYDIESYDKYFIIWYDIVLYNMIQYWIVLYDIFFIWFSIVFYYIKLYHIIFYLKKFIWYDIVSYYIV